MPSGFMVPPSTDLHNDHLTAADEARSGGGSAGMARQRCAQRGGESVGGRLDRSAVKKRAQ